MHPTTFCRMQARSKRALIVTGNAEIGAAITDLLKELDYAAWAAADASTALALSAELQFDLALADVTLTGGLDGVELAHELRGRYINMGIIILVDPFDIFPEDIQEFITFRKPRPKVGARYEPLRFLFH